MLHTAWNSKGKIPYRFPRSSVKFQGHTVQNITDFDPNWVFPDYRPVAAFKSLRFALFKKFCMYVSITDNLQVQANQFEVATVRLRRKYWWKNLKVPRFTIFTFYIFLRTKGVRFSDSWKKGFRCFHNVSSMVLVFGFEALTAESVRRMCETFCDRIKNRMIRNCEEI